MQNTYHVQKELNSELFEEIGASGPRNNRSLSSHELNHKILQATDQKILNVDTQISELRGQQQNTQDQLSRLISQVSEFIRNTQVKTERMTQVSIKLDQQQSGLAQEISQKMTHLSSRLSERKTLDAKIQEMIDRHNQVIKGFEVRLSQLQKILAEKESQIQSYHASLNECKMEISRLKRL